MKKGISREAFVYILLALIAILIGVILIIFWGGGAEKVLKSLGLG
ncbi:MAG: hypothetical protein QXU88_00935 [Candidatus Woesearchaeota archaeon]